MDRREQACTQNAQSTMFWELELMFLDMITFSNEIGPPIPGSQIGETMLTTRTEIPGLGLA